MYIIAFVNMLQTYHGVLLYAKSQSGSIVVHTGETCTLRIVVKAEIWGAAHLPIIWANSESHVLEVRTCEIPREIPRYSVCIWRKCLRLKF